MPDDPKRQRFKTLAAAAIAVPAVLYAGRLVYTEWNTQAPFRRQAAAERERAQEFRHRWATIESVADRLAQNGAVVAPLRSKTSPSADLTGWRADPAALDDLPRLASLLENASKEDGAHFALYSVELGTNIDASYLPTLRRLKGLGYVVLNGADLTESEIAVLARDLPGTEFYWRAGYDQWHRPYRVHLPVEAPRPAGS